MEESRRRDGIPDLGQSSGVQDKIIFQTVGTTNVSPTTESFTPVSNLPTGNYRVWIQAINGGSTAPWSAFLDFAVV